MTESASKPGWHALRFTEDPTKIRQDCKVCERPMWLPPSKVHWHIHCGLVCASVTRNIQREDRRRQCETCSAVFWPRQIQLATGGGRFCSQRCNTASRAALATPGAQARAKSVVSRMRANGLIKAACGPAHHNWKGGKGVWVKRRYTYPAKPDAAAKTREYRRNNPHVMRESAKRRAGRKTTRLPRGTIMRIGGAQKWRCAICRIDISQGYHMDHIMPLARGGEHAPRNLQLLCQTCNVRKSAKDPIDYMRSLGRLL